MMDVICSGLNVVDLLVSVPTEVPKGEKTICEKIVLQGGAPAGNAACALASLGHDTGYIGYFGNNILSEISKSELQKHGVKSDLFKENNKASPAIAVVYIDDKGERTVLYSKKEYKPFDPKDVDETFIAQAQLILVDGYDDVINTHLLQVAQKYGIRSVLDLESTSPEIMQEMLLLATDSILPLEAAQKLTRKELAEDCLIALVKMTAGQVVITDGVNGSYALEEGEVIHQPSFKVSVVDTTGCGDSFHAAYASSLLQGMNLKQRMKYASFYAAQVARHFGGRTFLPNREFMIQNCPVKDKAHQIR